MDGVSSAAHCFTIKADILSGSLASVLSSVDCINLTSTILTTITFNVTLLSLAGTVRFISVCAVKFDAKYILKILALSAASVAESCSY